MTDDDVLTVLVAIDFSDSSHAALAWATDYALRAPCELHLVHVVEDHLSDLLRGEASKRISSEMFVITREAQVELDRMAPESADRESLGTIYRHVARGRPATEILALAEKIGAELIVVGKRGRTTLAQILVGSVAEKIVRLADCPVVCVKAPPAADE